MVVMGVQSSKQLYLSLHPMNKMKRKEEIRHLLLQANSKDQRNLAQSLLQLSHHYTCLLFFASLGHLSISHLHFRY